MKQKYAKLSVFVIFSLVLITFISGSVVAMENLEDKNSSYNKNLNFDGTQHLELLTGDSVYIEQNNKGDINVTFEDKIKGKYIIEDVGDDYYVIPKGYDEELYDKELFNVVELAKIDNNLNSIPVIIEYKNSSSGAGILDANQYISVKNNYNTLNYASANIMTNKKQKIETFNKNRIKKVWLDKRAEVKLTESKDYIELPKVKKYYNLTGDGVDVAVLDTGIDSDHADLEDDIVYEENFVSGENTTKDLYNHGTAVAGIISGDGVENANITGIAPESDIYNMRVLGKDGSSPVSDIINGILKADQKGVDIISMSLGANLKRNNPLNDVVNDVVKNGTVVIASAGNNGGYRTITSPADAQKSIAVGADNGLEVASFSSEGPVKKSDGFIIKPDITAPGVNINSANSGGGYNRWTGTSFSAPHLTGMVALMMENNQNITTQNIRSDIVTTADKIGDDIFESGGGQLNASKAINPTVRIDNPKLEFYFNNSEFRKTKSNTFQITNLRQNTENFYFSGTLKNIDGDSTNNYTVRPSNISLSPNESEKVTVNITADKEDSGFYTGKIKIEDSSRNNVGSVPIFYRQPKNSSNSVEIKIDTIDQEKGGNIIVADDNMNQITRGSFGNDNKFEFIPETSGPFVVATSRYRPNSSQVVMMTDIIEDTSKNILLSENRTKEYDFNISSIQEKRGNLLNYMSKSTMRFTTLDGTTNSITLGDFGIKNRKGDKEYSARYFAPKSHNQIEFKFEYLEIMVPEKTHDRLDGLTLQNERVYEMMVSSTGFDGKNIKNISESRMRRIDATYNRNANYIGDIGPKDDTKIYHSFRPKGVRSTIELLRDIGNQYNQDYYYTTENVNSKFGVFVDGGKYKEYLPREINPDPNVITANFNTRPFLPKFNSFELSNSKIKASGNYYYDYLNDELSVAVKPPSSTNSLSVYLNDKELRSIDGLGRTFGFNIRDRYKKIDDGYKITPIELEDGDSVEVNLESNGINRYNINYAIKYQQGSFNKPPTVSDIRSPDINKNNALLYNPKVDTPFNISINSTKNIKNITVLYNTTRNKWKEADVQKLDNNLYRSYLSLPPKSEDINLKIIAVNSKGSSSKVKINYENVLQRDFGSFSGKLVGEYGKPIVNTKIKVMGENTTYDTITTDNQGRFSFATFRKQNSEKDYYLEFNSNRLGNISNSIIDNGRENITIQADRLSPPPISNSHTKPKDIDGDNLYEDVNGDGYASIIDVQSLFVYMNSERVKYNSAFFNFSGISQNRVSIFDVQALFYDIT